MKLMKMFFMLFFLPLFIMSCVQPGTNTDTGNNGGQEVPGPTTLIEGTVSITGSDTLNDVIIVAEKTSDNKTGTVRTLLNTISPIRGQSRADSVKFVTSSDENGAYQFEDIPEGTYTVTATRENTLGAVYTGVIVVQQVPVELDILMQATGSLSGKALLEPVQGTDSDLSNTIVYLTGTSYTAITDASGDFTISNIPAGTYSVTYYHQGYAESFVENIAISPERTTVIPVQTLTVGMLEVIYSSIADGDSNIAVNDIFCEVYFNKVIDPASITSATITLSNGVTDLPVVTVFDGGSSLYIKESPSNLIFLDYSTDYSITIPTSVRAVDGTSMEGAYLINFETHYSPPGITGVFPVNDSSEVALNTNITATFNTQINPGTLTLGLRDDTGAAIAGNTVYDMESKTATFIPETSLRLNTRYFAEVLEAKDLNGVSIHGYNNATAAQDYNAAWSFTTMKSHEIINGDFTEGSREWTLNSPGSIVCTMSVIDETLQLTLPNSSTGRDDIMLTGGSLKLLQDTAYRLTFTGKSTVQKEIAVGLRQNAYPWTKLDEKIITLAASTTMQNYSVTFKTMPITTEDACLYLSLGDMSNTPVNATQIIDLDSFLMEQTTINPGDDTTGPVITSTSPGTGTILNNTRTLSGMITDDLSGVRTFYIGNFTDLTDAEMESLYNTPEKLDQAASQVQQVNTWTMIEKPDTNWSFAYNTRIISTGIKNPYVLYLAACDNSGNISYVKHTFTIDQTFDKPYTEIHSAADGDVIYPLTTINGRCEDDDGLSAIYWCFAQKDAGVVVGHYRDWGESDTPSFKSGVIDTSAGLPLSQTWQVQSPTGSGEYVLYIMPVDMYGTIQDTYTMITLIQNTTPLPVLEVTGPTSGLFFTGNVTVDFNAYAGYGAYLDRIYYQIESEVKTSEWQSIIVDPEQDSLSSQFTFSIDEYLSGTVHDVNVSVYCRNTLTYDSLSSMILLKGDKTPATLSITTPDEGMLINGVCNISGVVTDDYTGVKALYIGYFTAMSAGQMDVNYDTQAELEAATGVTPVLDSWVKISDPPLTWEYSFDTTVVASLTADPYELYVAAVDNAGNVSYTSRTVAINQDTDNPTASITSPREASMIFPASIATGVCTDDDGLSSIYWYLAKDAVSLPSHYTTWGIQDTSDVKSGIIDLTSTSPLTYTWQLALPDDVGQYTLLIRPVDIHGQPAPANTVVSFTQQLSDLPEIMITGPALNVIYSNDLTVDISATGGSIDEITGLEYNITSDHSPDTGWHTITGFSSANTVNHSFTIDVTPYVSAAVHDVLLSVRCINENDKQAQASVYLKADITSPVVAIQTPASNADVNGWSTLSGSAADDFSGVKALYISYFETMNDAMIESSYNTEQKLEQAAVTTKEINTWFKISQPAACWSYTYDTTIFPNTVYNAYPLYVAVVDECGNVAYTSQTVTIDQAYDAPTAAIVSPQVGAVVYPGSTATGICEDDDGLKAIYWYAAKTINPPPADCLAWGTQNTTEIKSGIIDLSATYPSSYMWQVTLPEGTGEYTLYIRPVDINESYAPANTTVTFMQQVSDTPVITIVGPDPSITQQGNIELDVIANGSGGNIEEIAYRVSSDLNPGTGWTIINDFTPSTTVEKTITIDSTNYVDDTVRDLKINVYCKDLNATNSAIVTTYLRADNFAPDLSITSPGSGTIFSGVEELSGIVSDYSVVDALYISYHEHCDPADYATQSALDSASTTDLNASTFNKWYKISSPPIVYSHDFDTSIITDGASMAVINNHTIYVAAVDRVGNIAFASINGTISQDPDVPLVSVTNPSYSGSITTPWTGVGDMGCHSATFTVSGTASDDDGVGEVRLDLDLMDYTGSGMSINTSVLTGETVTGTNNWSYTFTGLNACSEGSQFYRITPYVQDINLREEMGSPVYFIVSHEAPVVEILSPSTVDPDGDQRYDAALGKGVITDPFGTTISNIADDMYWDNNSKNNHVYPADHVRFFFGWDNLVADDDTDINGYPDVNNDGSVASSTYAADLDESVLGIFDQENADTTASSYYRMICRIKDGNVDGSITKIEVSYDNGTNWETAFYNAGNPVGPSDTSQPATYALESTHGDGYYWFYANIDTTDPVLGNSTVIKVRVSDDNMPMPYIAISSVLITTDNTAPTGDIISWGSDGSQIAMTATNGYLGGTALDLDAGIRCAVIYIWENQGPDEFPAYGYPGSSSETVTAVVDSGTFYVSITAPEDIDTGDSDGEADHMITAQMINSMQWQITNISDTQTLSTGKKLIGLQVTDNAGNTGYSFQEVVFSE